MKAQLDRLAADYGVHIPGVPGQRRGKGRTGRNRISEGVYDRIAEAPHRHRPDWTGGLQAALA